MKNKHWILISTLVFAIIVLGSCHRKYGCPSNGKNVGAERLMSGEKVPRAKKFKS
jgi:hypothetical protein